MFFQIFDSNDYNVITMTLWLGCCFCSKGWFRTGKLPHPHHTGKRRWDSHPSCHDCHIVERNWVIALLSSCIDHWSSTRSQSTMPWPSAQNNQSEISSCAKKCTLDNVMRISKPMSFRFLCVRNVMLSLQPSWIEYLLLQCHKVC